MHPLVPVTLASNDAWNFQHPPNCWIPSNKLSTLDLILVPLSAADSPRTNVIVLCSWFSIGGFWSATAAVGLGGSAVARTGCATDARYESPHVKVSDCVSCLGLGQGSPFASVFVSILYWFLKVYQVGAWLRTPRRMYCCTPKKSPILRQGQVWHSDDQCSDQFRFRWDFKCKHKRYVVRIQLHRIRLSHKSWQDGPGPGQLPGMWCEIFYACMIASPSSSIPMLDRERFGIGA